MEIYDVIVVGAGPGGTTAATMVARAGLRTLILDRGQQPATHLPETWWNREQPVLQELGINAAQLSECYGETHAQFLDPTGSYGLRISLATIGSGVGPIPLRLDRNRFDALLVQKAQAAGTEYATQHMVTGIELVSGDLGTITCSTPMGERRFQAPFIIDASGKSALLARKLGLMTNKTRLDDRIALFSHFEGPIPEPLNSANSMTLIPIESGYVFAIPINDRRISIGVVVGEQYGADQKGEPQALFESVLKQLPVVSAALRDARQVLPTIPAMNETYEASSVAGPGYMLVGDAAVFLDPFYCNGIDLALQSGYLAGSTAARLLRSQSLSEHQQLAEEYMAGFQALLQTYRQGVYSTFDQGFERHFLATIADPHLPMVVPLLLGLQRVLLNGPAASGAAQEIIHAARQVYAAL